jgi:hypothetical protein
MRPWTETEVPVGKLVRFRMGDSNWFGRIERIEKIITLHVANSPMLFRPAEALWLLEYCEDDTLPPEKQVWLECGVMEAQPLPPRAS